MNHMNRREFICRSAGTLAAVYAAPSYGATVPAGPLATTVRSLGSTGVSCTLLGLGTGTRGGGGNSNQTRLGMDKCVGLLEYGHQRGLTYFDLADQYGSHKFMAAALNGGISRDKVMILTKTRSRDEAGVRADMERFRTEVGTDYFDIVLLHCLRNPGWTTTLKPCMDALADAKAKGLIRAHGVSCHDLRALEEAAETDWVDVILARINHDGVKMDAEPEKVVPVLRKAHEAGKGILGMKIVGEGRLGDKVSESLEYVLGLGCVDAMTIGFESREQLDDAVTRIEVIAQAQPAT